jgi:hypothetical protein
VTIWLLVHSKDIPSRRRPLPRGTWAKERERDGKGARGRNLRISRISAQIFSFRVRQNRRDEMEKAIGRVDKCPTERPDHGWTGLEHDLG